VSISCCLPFRHDTSIVEQATIDAYALVWRQYAPTRTDGEPCLVQLTVLDKDILFIISYEYRLVALCSGKQYCMCFRYSSALCPSCCLRIAAHRVCFVQIELQLYEYYVGPLFYLTTVSPLSRPPSRAAEFWWWMTTVVGQIRCRYRRVATACRKFVAISDSVYLVCFDYLPRTPREATIGFVISVRPLVCSHGNVLTYGDRVKSWIQIKY
jgi:hypothetical protein